MALNVRLRAPESAAPLFTVIKRLLDGGKLSFVSLETEQGKRYQIEGRVTLGEVLQIPGDPAAPYRLRPQRDSNPR